MAARFLLVCGWLAAVFMVTEARGQNWTNITPDPGALDIKKVVMVDSARAYGIDRWDYRIYRTIDGADSWDAQNVGFDYLNDLFFADTQTGWAVGNSGQVYKTTNGQHWAVQESTVSDDLNAVFFLDSQTGWAVGNYGTLVTTVNGGQTWAADDIGSSEDLLGIYFLDANNGWIVGRNQALFTDDGGVNWYFATTHPSSTYPAHEVFFFDVLNGVASVGNSETDMCSVGADRVWRTSDGGANWSEVLSPTHDVLDLKITGADSARIVTQDGSVYTTSDRGQTWQPQTPLFDFDGASDVDMLDSNTGILTGEAGTVMTTADGGASWLRLGTGTNNTIHDITFLDEQRGWYISSSAAFETTDGGAHWTVMPFHTDFCWSKRQIEEDLSMHFVEVLPDDSILILASFDDFDTNSGIVAYKSVDSGGSWQEFRDYSNYLGLNGAHFPTASRGFGVGWSGEIWTSGDGGIGWNQQTSGTFQTLNGVHFVNATEGWAVGSMGTILHTANGGNLWSPQSAVGNNLYGVFMASATTGWAVGDYGSIFHTANGTNWSSQFSAGMVPFYSVACAGAGTCWAVGGSGQIYHTTDGGGQWTQQANGLTTRILQTLFILNSNLAYAAGSNGTVLMYSGGSAPVADAGSNQIVNEGSPVVLDGSGSYDPLSLELSYLWEQQSGTPVDIVNDDQDLASIVAPSVCSQEVLVFRLTVDNLSASDWDETSVTVQDSVDLPPSADAGGDQTVNEGASVLLDGGSSTDDCGISSYAWAQLDGTDVDLLTPGLSTTQFIAPAVCGTEVLTFELTVDDGSQQDSDQVLVTVQNPDNAAPSADAGPDQNVDEATLVTLDGSASSDDCGIISYFWEQLSGTSVTLQTPDAETTQFQAPPVCTDQDLIFRLTVDDGTQQASDMVVVSVANVSQLPPAADAGLDFEVDELSQVQLDGASSHADCGELSYAWTQLGGVDVGLSGSDTASPSFEAPPVCSQQILVFRLTVTDEQSATDQDEVAVTVRDALNSAPLADAGPDQEVNEGVTVELDGNLSSDDCGPLQFAWYQLSGPAIVLQDPATPTPTFLAPQVSEPTIIIIGLTVSDGSQDGNDQVEIAVFDESVQFPPIILETANLQATVDQPYIYDADGRAEATGNPPIEWSVTQGPADFHIDAQTGAIGWLPGIAGDIPITIQAENDHGIDEYEFTVTVESGQFPPPVAFITTDPAVPEGVAPFDILLDGNQSHSAAGIVSYKWYLGDGSPVEFGASAAHIYLRPGGYTARLVVTDARGMTGTDQVNITVLEESSGPRPPTANIVASALDGVDQLSVDFSCSCQEGDAQIQAYLWDFGDASISNDEEVTHSFSVGRYRVWLTVLDGNGLAAYDFLDITVTEGELMPPLVEAGADPPSGNAPLSVRFIGLAADLDGVIDQRGWDFGDGDSADGDRAEHQYNAPGNYLASFYAQDNDGLRSTATIEIQVLQNGATSPRIISVPQTSVTAGQSYSYDRDGRPSARGSPTLSWSLVDSPEDMVIDAGSGELSWTPTEDQVGNHLVALKVDNPAGSDLQEFEIEVFSSGIEPPTDSGCSCSMNGRAPGVRWLPLLTLGALLLRRRRRA